MSNEELMKYCSEQVANDIFASDAMRMKKAALMALDIKGRFAVWVDGNATLVESSPKPNKWTMYEDRIYYTTKELFTKFFNEVILKE